MRPYVELKTQYINVNVVNGQCKINTLLLDYFTVILNCNLIAIDVNTGQSMQLIPFDYENEESNVTFFKFVPENNIVIPDWTGKLLRRFHWTWYYEMQEYLESEKFKTVNKVLNNEQRKKYVIYPEQKDVYNSFNTPYDRIKVVIIGQSPYPNANANGNSFATKLSSKPVSLQALENAVGTLPNDLSNWIEQGVMLLNSSLTVGPNSNIEFHKEWRPFMIETVKALNRKDFVVYILMGTSARNLQSIIDKKHSIIHVEHPAAASYDNRVWNHANCFDKTNELLTNQRKQIIKWSN